MRRLALSLLLCAAAASPQAVIVGPSTQNVGAVSVSTTYLYYNKMHFAGTWGSSLIYSAQDTVIASGLTYVSLQIANVNHTPASSPLWWTPIGTAGTVNPTENGAANAIACSAGCGPTLTNGLVVTIKLAHTLQIGANTFAYNGGGALNIKSHNNVANNIAAAYASGSLVQLGYDGTQWQDMSQ